MAQENFSDDENHKTVQELFFSAEFVRGVESELIFLSALNIFLSVTAFLGNTLILVALHKETSLHPPSKLLYRNLAIADLCSLYWCHCRAFACDLLYFCCERKMGYLLLRRLGSTLLRSYFVYSVFINNDCNKRGQTFRLVAGAEIQTSCNL